MATDLLFEPRHLNTIKKSTLQCPSMRLITITWLLKEEYFNFEINVDRYSSLKEII